jgi:hypothetical protein
MKEYIGWLFDLYVHKDGIVLWLLGEDKFNRITIDTNIMGGPVSEA